MTELVRVSEVAKSYRDGEQEVKVLQQVNLSLVAGEMLAIIGSSGSGKSTLLHILGGLDQADSGTIRVGEQQVQHLTGRRLARWRNQQLGFIYQFHHLLGEFTALENVAMPLLIAGHTATEARARAARMLARTGLDQRLSHYPAQLSGGERQRVAIARALVNRPALVLADEPTGNLDDDTALVIYDLMRELNQEFGTAFIVVTHDHELARRLPRQLLLSHGQLRTPEWESGS